MKADTIITNVVGHYCHDNIRPLSAVAIAKGRIIYVGEWETAQNFRCSETSVIDGQCAWVLPGFVDAHCHPFAYAIQKLCIDCSDAHSIVAIQEKVCAWLRAPGLALKNRWIHAANCDIDTILRNDRVPTRFDLDTVCCDIPLLLVDRNGQRCVLNTLALERCRIIDGGNDSALGHRGGSRFTGFIEGVDPRVISSIPPIDDESFGLAAKLASSDFLSNGVTAVHDTSWNNSVSHWQRLVAIKNNCDFAPRILFMPGVEHISSFVDQELNTGCGNHELRIGATKIALDESSEDFPTQEDINNSALVAHESGFQLAFHAPDTRLLRYALNAISFVAQHSLTSPLRPRLEHCPLCPPDLIDHILKVGASVVVQPNLLLESDSGYRALLPAPNHHWLCPLRSLLGRGVNIAFGSDAPLTPIDPLRALGGVIYRQHTDCDNTRMDEKITLVEAVRAYTTGGAFASGLEHSYGFLKPGMLADIVLVKNFQHIAPISDKECAEENTEVLATFVGGKLAWEAEN